MRSDATLGVLLDPGDQARSLERSTDHFGAYARELLEHAGVPFVALERGDLTRSLPPLVLLPYQVRLSPQEAAALESHARGGGGVVACGGVEGADEIFGITTTRSYLAEASLRWPEGGLGLPGGAIPVWGAQLATFGGNDAETLGDLGGAGETGIGACRRRLGDGIVLYLAIDVCRSIVTMQQGVPVLGDGRGAPDGSAAINDRLLKCDDGAVIDWRYRATTAEGPTFTIAFGDRLRELLLAALASCAEALNLALPMGWYWPDAVPAVGTLSFDTDSNEGPDGRRFLEVLERLEVKGTWCVMFPGGYPRDLYDAIATRGHEIALHFDGLTTDLNGAPHCGWSEEDFRHQHAWVLEETGVHQVMSQKNHVTRWEGLVEFFRWVERAGIAVEQSKGPSKIGNQGFTFGTCHLWRPLEDQRHDNRIMDLFELPFLTHDMHTSERRVALRRTLIDAVKMHAGVAHFIFHPQRIHEPGMPEALADAVTYARAQGVPWWTSEAIAGWEKARRSVRVRVHRGEASGSIEVVVDDAPPGFTLLLFGVAHRNYRADPAVKLDRADYLGHTALQVVLAEGQHRIHLLPADAEA